MAKIPTIEQMLKAGMHFGHRTSKWHPKMEQYIFTSRNGVHIIDLLKSRQLLEEACNVIEKYTAEGKSILFVGTKMQVKKPLKTIAEETGMHYVTEKWMGGCLTNFSIIRKLITKYTNYVSDKEAGKLDKYTKKERLELDRDMTKLETKVGGLTKMTRVPDLLFVWDIKKEKTAIQEAVKRNIPVIGLCDTNTNPKDITYVIPSNDDATKTIKLVLATIKDAIEEGKKKASK
jgi:small subunit ribosomal protein S2